VIIPLVRLPPLPWRILAVAVAAGVLAGAAFGFVRGPGQRPTLPLSIAEGVILFSVPAAILGLILAGSFSVATRRRTNVLVDTGRGRICALIFGLAGAALVVAAATLPWASYRRPAMVTARHLNAGPLSVALLAAGGIAVALGIIQFLRPFRIVAEAGVVVGGVAIVIAAAAALTRVAVANGRINTGGWSAYGLGGGVGLLAGIAITISSVWVMISRGNQLVSDADAPRLGRAPSGSDK
jgi:hypothetical protein